MDQIAIQTNQLTRYFGERVAVNKLNLTIRKGEIFSLLGTNGAGKTTTIKMLCCLLPQTSGEAFLNGFQLSKEHQEIKKIIGVSPQESAIAEHLTSKENLLLMGGVFGLSSEENRKRALNLILDMNNYLYLYKFHLYIQDNLLLTPLLLLQLLQVGQIFLLLLFF